MTGVLSGACTNPPALAYAGEQDKNSENAAVGYATVYPLSMFLRVLFALQAHLVSFQVTAIFIIFATDNQLFRI